MNPLWLLLIIPCSAWFGYFLSALMIVSKGKWNDSSKK